MAFVVPNFNITCNVWHSPVIPPVGLPAIAGLACQLTMDGRIITTGLGGGLRSVMLLKVPSGTDLRGQFSSTSRDTVECPAGSGRYYTCWAVDDVSRGFANQYRLGFIVQENIPTPLT